jgi:endo-1,4-beta-xylanase
MNAMFKVVLPATLIVSMLFSCSKSDSGGTSGGVEPPPPVTTNPPDSTTALKEVAGITVGVAVPYNHFISSPAYAAVVRRDFDGITLENEMKHYSIVRNDGTNDFTRADAMVAAAQAANLEVFGHTLVWHRGQNSAYLKTAAGIVQASGPDLSRNGGFEEGTATGFDGWTVWNTDNNAQILVGGGTAEVYEGTRSMKVVNPVANAGNQWRVQVAGDFINTTNGSQYLVSFWIKAAAAGGSIRLSSGTPTGQGSAQYQADQTIGTTWKEVTWAFTANAPQTRIVFDMGQAANTYFVDKVTVRELSQVGGTAVAAKVDEALNKHIAAMVGRYKGKVKAWDVVNELFTESGAIRNTANTTDQESDVFVWSHYLGRDLAVKAFNYAKAADPEALLFINDYNLELNSAKLDSLIAYVKELQGKGVKIDGIGTQMHVNINSNRTSIDNMMKKLAATGLKVRISELDVRMNPTNRAGYVLNATEAAAQANLYKYIINAYLKNVPKAQQHGVTVWGLTDNTSWMYSNGLDFPLLYNANLSKKPAYTSALLAFWENK